VSFDILSTFVWVLNAAQFLGAFVLYFPSDLPFGAVFHHRIYPETGLSSPIHLLVQIANALIEAELQW
jgi:hypothetical protein